MQIAFEVFAGCPCLDVSADFFKYAAKPNLPDLVKIRGKFVITTSDAKRIPESAPTSALTDALRLVS